MTVRGKRRCPPGVTNAATSPRSAQRRKVAGVTPSRRLASPRLSHGDLGGGTSVLNRQIMLKTIESLHAALPGCRFRRPSLEVSARMLELE